MYCMYTLVVNLVISPSAGSCASIQSHVQRATSSIHSLRLECICCVQHRGQLCNFITCAYVSHSVYIAPCAFLSLIFLIHTRIYTQPKPSRLFKNLRVFESLIELYTLKSLPIFDFETSFGFPVSRAFHTYLFQHDPQQFFERVFRNLQTSWTVLYVIFASIIFETDTIILRISRRTTYCNFIKI